MFSITNLVYSGSPSGKSNSTNAFNIAYPPRSSNSFNQDSSATSYPLYQSSNPIAAAQA